MTTIPVPTFTPFSHTPIARQLEGLPFARDLVCKATAPDRQRARVVATLEAALRQAGHPTDGSRLLGSDEAGIVGLVNQDHAAAAVAALAIDMHGVGGPLQAGGINRASVRPVFGWRLAPQGFLQAAVGGTLGKGRWEASDGIAWRVAAIKAIEILMRQARIKAVTLEPLNGGVILVANYTDATESEFGDVQEPQWTSVEVATTALARHAILACIGKREPEVGHPAVRVVATEESLGAWATLLEALETQALAMAAPEPFEDEIRD